MITCIDRKAVTVVAATRLEAGAVRAAAPGVRVVTGGVALRRCRDAFDYGDGEFVVSCGVAGALRGDLPTGSVVIPQTVLRPDGESLVCDPALVTALDGAARRLGFQPLCAPLLTSATLVTGAARREWAERGYAAVDMETGLITAPRVAAVRVILDTPERELSAAWLQPATALLHPETWGQAMWLGREAPRCARIAARVLANALGA